MSNPTNSEQQAKKTDLSSKYDKWDKLAKEVDKEDEEEDGGVDKLFKKIYKDANDDVRRAMVKSFTESQGTVLSTNWGEVGKQQVEMKPPEDSEFKKYEK